MSAQRISDAHIDEIDLELLVRRPGDKDLAVQRQHLALCATCRQNLENMQSSEMLVAEHASLLSQHSQATSLRAQLHEITHGLAMNNALATSAEKQNTASEQKSTHSRQKLIPLLQQLFVGRAPIWSIPSAALAAFLCAWVLIGPTISPSSGVVEFQDSSALVMTKASTPGLGFFSEAQKDSRVISNYTGFNVQSDRKQGHVRVSWPAIVGVTRYDVTLFEISDNTRQQLQRVSTDDNYWEIPHTMMRPGRLYRLSLTGKTDDNYVFQHTGGFVFRNL